MDELDIHFVKGAINISFDSGLLKDHSDIQVDQIIGQSISRNAAEILSTRF